MSKRKEWPLACWELGVHLVIAVVGDSTNPIYQSPYALEDALGGYYSDHPFSEKRGVFSVVQGLAVSK